MIKRWTKEEVEFLKENYPKFGVGYIVKALNFSSRRVAGKCYELKLRKNLGARHSNYKGYMDISGHLWAQMKNNARTRNVPFLISIEYAWKIFEDQNGICKLSGIPLKIKEVCRGSTVGTASLDRIDSSKPYIEGNVQWVHKDINIMKNMFTQYQFVDYCRLISNYCGDMIINKTNTFIYGKQIPVVN